MRQFVQQVATALKFVVLIAEDEIFCTIVAGNIMCRTTMTTLLIPELGIARFINKNRAVL